MHTRLRFLMLPWNYKGYDLHSVHSDDGEMMIMRNVMDTVMMQPSTWLVTRLVISILRLILTEKTHLMTFMNHGDLWVCPTEQVKCVG